MGRDVYWLMQLTSPVACGMTGFSNTSINLGPMVTPVWVLGQLHPDSEWPWGKNKLLLSKKDEWTLGKQEQQISLTWLDQIPQHFSATTKLFVAGQAPGCNPVRNCQAAAELLLTWSQLKWARPGGRATKESLRISDTAF